MTDAEKCQAIREKLEAAGWNLSKQEHVFPDGTAVYVMIGTREVRGIGGCLAEALEALAKKCGVENGS